MPELSDLNRFAIIITGSDYAAEAREVKIMINAINLIDNIKIFMFIKTNIDSTLGFAPNFVLLIFVNRCYSIIY